MEAGGGARVTVFGVPERAYFVLNLRTDIRQNAYIASEDKCW